MSDASKMVRDIPGKLGCPSSASGYSLLPDTQLSARILPEYDEESGSFLFELTYTLASNKMPPPTVSVYISQGLLGHLSKARLINSPTLLEKQRLLRGW